GRRSTDRLLDGKNIVKNTVLPLALAVFGGVMYHVSQKSVPKTVDPYSAIIIAYAIGIVLCIAAMWIDPAGKSFAASLRESNWAVIALGVGAVLIEVSVLLAYRLGSNISTTSVVINISVALILLPIGIIVYKEHLSAQSVAGIACCLFGLYLISKR